MQAVNIFSAENLECRVDVARAVGSTATAMFIYDLAPGQSQSPYHYEYGSESPARTLMFSSSRVAAVSVYPDSDKIGRHQASERFDAVIAW